jgi:simple sugar transport system permease protein
MLAGLGGASQALGVTGYYVPGGISGYGFDGITIALLAKLNPKSIVPSALLIGAMRASRTALQADAKIAPEIIDVIVAIMLLMVAAPVLARTLLRIKSDPGQELQLTAGWGS